MAALPHLIRDPLLPSARGLLPFRIPEGLGLVVGYGFVVASLIMTGIKMGKAGLSDLLRRFLIWRVGWIWYGIVLLGPATIYLVAILITALITGAAPDFSQMMARKIFEPRANLAFFIPGFFVFNLLGNGEEVGWRGYALPPNPTWRRIP